MDLSLHSQGRRASDRETGGPLQTRLPPGTQRHVHAGRQMARLPLQHARPDARLCGRGSAGKEKWPEPSLESVLTLEQLSHLFAERFARRTEADLKKNGSKK